MYPKAKIVLFYLLSLSSFAQRSDNDFLVWPQLILRTDAENKLSYEGIAQVRLFENRDLQLAALSNGIYLKPNKQPIYFGADYTVIIADAGSDFRQIHWIQPKIEYRPKVSDVNLLFRLMYAHLWIFDLDGTPFKADDDRIRFLYQVSFPIIPNLRVIVNDEIFVLGRDSWMRENRFQCALSTKIDTKNSISIGYFYRWIGSTQQINNTKYENALTVAYIYSFLNKK